MDMSTLVYFLAAAVVLTLAPGPDILYLLAKSLSDGAKSGIALAAGLASGPFFHTLLVIVGVAAFIQGSPTAFFALKAVGAAYLLYLAAISFRAKGDIRLSASDGRASYMSLYRRGVLMNVLNPKVLLFFLAFLPQFVDGAANMSGQIAILGAVFSVQAFVVFSAVAAFAGRVRRFILSVKNLNAILGKVQGLVLLFIALVLLFE